MIGFIGISNGAGFIQRGINFFSGGPSHSFLMAGKLAGEESVLETTEFRIRPASFQRQYLDAPGTWELWAVNAPLEQRREAIRRVYCQYTDVWYAYLSFPWYMIWFGLEYFGIRRPDQIARWAQPGLHCSELCSRYLLEMGGAFAGCLQGRDPNVITPRDLREILSTHPALFLPFASDSDLEPLEKYSGSCEC